MQTEHPRDSIPAYVLGALDSAEALLVREHLAICPACRAEAESFQAVVGMLPYAAGAQKPPPRVKHQLLARVAVAREMPAAPPATRPARRWYTPLARAAALLQVAAVVSLGWLVVDARGQVAQLRAQLARSEQEVVALREQLGRDVQLVAFIGQPGTVAQPLPATERAAGASAQMYMQPGHTEVALVVQNLPPLAPGKIYRLWLASEDELVPVGTLARADGVTQFHGHAPAPMDSYAQVMVTVDDAGQEAAPGGVVLFETEL
jgi:anti-sigma factor RsiW